MSNHLAGQTSPYLIQHIHNPVDWYPWCDEAFDEARVRDKPIFLSIGYSACHWCHVMEEESFEDSEIARELNRDFVSIKVDREQRPDVDRVYMEAVQAMTGRGGWPLSVFLTPSRKPFFGGTYWPPHPRDGSPGFDQVLHAVAQAWRGGRDSLRTEADDLTEQLAAAAEADESGGLDRALVEQAHAALVRQFDGQWGGFGAAPKFPSPLQLRFVLRCARAWGFDRLPAMVSTTLDRMAAGGIYDQLGGGFHRYSTDRRWLVPHFEKMLCDNAMLATCYLEAWLAGGPPRWRRVVVETLDYVLREMTHVDGGFFTSQDADVEGHEGDFYLWTPEEIHDVLGPKAAKTFCNAFHVTEDGNFEGRNILHRSGELESPGGPTSSRAERREAMLAASRHKLLAARESRRRPGRDEKILASWNGLMIDAMARAGASLGEPRYLDAAARAAEFVLAELGETSGRLRHAWCEGQTTADGFLDDYAAMTDAMVTLYETRSERRWLDVAVRLADRMLAQFADRQRGGFFYTAADGEPMITRVRDMHDASTPSGGGLATMALLRLAKLGRREDYWQVARASLRSAADTLGRWPMATGQLLLALQMYLEPPIEIAIVGGDNAEEDRETLAELYRRFIPNKVVGYMSTASNARQRPPRMLDDKPAVGPGTTVYVCRGETCESPAVGREAAIRTWDRLAGGSLVET